MEISSWGGLLNPINLHQFSKKCKKFWEVSLVLLMIQSVVGARGCSLLIAGTQVRWTSNWETITIYVPPHNPYTLTPTLKVSYTEPFKYQFSITITGVGDLQVTNTNGYVCHLIHSGHSHYHHWCWWSSVHQHQRFCTRPLEELSNEYTTLNSSEQPNLHQLSLQVTSEEFLNYQSSIEHSSDLSSISHVNHVIFSIEHSSDLSSIIKVNHVLSSVQHSSIHLVFWSALIQAQCSSMQLNATVQGN